MDYIEENIKCIEQKIADAAKKSGRNYSDILLLAVTKTIDIERIKIAVNCGLKNLGENRVQELTAKYDELGNDCNWHMIGHLQTNKVKYIVDKVKLIHSVDSQKLAEEIDRQSKKFNLTADILLEVNIADEPSKFGIDPKNVEITIRNLSKLNNINIKGLMTVAPLVNDSENNRKYFEKLYNLFVDIRDKRIDNIDMKYLSMGMTNDYEVAIEQGANIVRIGTGIFGQRKYM